MHLDQYSEPVPSLPRGGIGQIVALEWDRWTYGMVYGRIRSEAIEIDSVRTDLG